MLSRYIVIFSIILALWFGAPSAILELINLYEITSPIGKAAYILLIISALFLARLNVSFLSMESAIMVILYGLVISFFYSVADLNASISPFLGAVLKVSLFVLLIGFVRNNYQTVFKPVHYSFTIIMLLGVVAIVIHNVLGVSEIARLASEDRHSSLLVGSFAAARIFVGDFVFYRISGFFYEPSNYGLLLYLLLTLYLINNKVTLGSRILLIANMLSTFSLGLFISLFVYSFSLLKMRVIYFWRRRSSIIIVPLSVILIAGLLSSFMPAISFVLDRISFSGDSGGKLISGDNRFYDDVMPNNILLGDGSYGGGFDSAISIFYQYGALGTVIFFLPMLIVGIKLVRNGNIALGIGMLLFLAHKPNILTPIVLILLSLIYVGQDRKRQGVQRVGVAN